MKRQVTHDALELADSIESQCKALLAHAERLRELAGEGGGFRHVNGADTSVEERWLSAEEVQALTGLGRGAVYRAGRAGKLGAIRIGRSMRFSARELAAWASNGGAR